MDKTLDEAILKALPTNQRDVKWMSTPALYAQLTERGHKFRYLKKLRRRLEAMKAAKLVVSMQEDGQREIYWQRMPWLTNDLAARMDAWDAVAFSMLERFGARRLPKAVFQDIEELFRAAEMRLSQERTDNRLHRAWADKVDSVDGNFALIRPNVKEDVFAAVTTALFFERILEIQYTSPASKRPGAAKRDPLRVWPLALVESGGLIYIVVQLDPASVKPDEITGSRAAIVRFVLRVDRIEKAQELPLRDAPEVSQTFVFPKDFKLRTFIDKEQQFNFLVEQPVHLRIVFDDHAGDHLFEESRMSADQKARRLADGRLLVEGTVIPSLKLRWWLRSFGDAVEVLQPASLREEFAKSSRKLAAKYRS
ncbi:YafY family protein [Caballeronia sp. Lep1P3]|uniref:helix-turn-helix transcriptional regulator n=1 Tax=Caballeronia sp. Lep1P3 TaxID=2878150 RepID=UPI001FD33E24|nr:WYL domain-containing protein [Caballeronia sp. Lep1P3]